MRGGAGRQGVGAFLHDAWRRGVASWHICVTLGPQVLTVGHGDQEEQTHEQLMCDVVFALSV